MSKGRNISVRSDGHDLDFQILASGGDVRIVCRGAVVKLSMRFNLVSGDYEGEGEIGSYFRIIRNPENQGGRMAIEVTQGVVVIVKKKDGTLGEAMLAGNEKFVSVSHEELS